MTSRIEVGALLFLGWAVGYVLLSYWNRETDAVELAEVWRAYALKMGDQVMLPGRYSWLSLRTSKVHAKLDGIRNGVPFEVEITRWDPEMPRDKTTTYTSRPTWLPDNGGVAITRSEPSSGWTFKTPVPALRTQRLNVYVHPPELVRVFEQPAAAKVLADFAKLPADCEAQGWRKDSQSKAQDGPSIMFIHQDYWCDDPDQLHAIIDVMTRLCALKASVTA
jgi:hypothetical protein